MMSDDNRITQDETTTEDHTARDREVKEQIYAHAARQQAINGAGSLLGAQALIDPDWQAREEKRDRRYLRETSLDKALGSYFPGAEPSVEDILARAKVIEAYLVGDA